jgi:hypothetical protein
MNRSLLTGYVANVSLILLSILLARGTVPGANEDMTFAVSQGLLILLLPVGIITLRGAIRSQGKFRRVLGYSVFGLDLVLSMSGLLVALMVLFAGARIAA